MSDSALTALFLLQVAAILAVCRRVGWPARFVAEVIAGFLIERLTLYMFVVGIEFRTTLLRLTPQRAAGVSIGGMVVPFAIGGALGFMMQRSGGFFAGSVSCMHAIVFVGAAMSVIAFSMLARIISERGMAGTALGTPGTCTRGRRAERSGALILLTMSSEIGEAFAKLWHDDPDRPLIYVPATNGVVTATDLGRQAAALTTALDSARVGAGELVISVIGNVPPAFSLFLACCASHRALMPLDAGTTAEEVARIADLFGASAIVAPRAMSLGANANPTPLTHATALHMAPATAPKPVYRDIAVLKVTSGSSGRPRATLTHEAALVSDGQTLVSAMDIRPQDVQIAAIPCSHSYGLGNLVMPLLLQGTAISLRDTFVPHLVPTDARKVGARHLPGAPYMFDHFATHLPREEWPQSLTRLVSAGAPLSAETAGKFYARFGVKVHPFYGTSETGGIAFDAGDAPVAAGVVGTALPGVDITLIPSDDSADWQGRVHVKSVAVSRGYAGIDDRDAFVGGGFLTGDLGKLDERQQLTLFGRVASFVNVAGRKVQPEEVERVLRQFPSIADVRVVGVEDALRGERLVACIVVAGAAPTTMQLRRFCSSHLAAHKIPRLFVSVDAIPLTVRGKTDRERLRALAQSEIARAGML